MEYVLLTASVLFAVLNNVFLHKYNEREERCNIFTFNAAVSLLWVAILLIVGLGFHPVSLSTIGYGVLYGSMIALFLLFKMLALGSGPVSITSLIGCCSLIIPTLAGVIVWKEQVGILQIIGLVVLFVGLFLCVDPKSDVKISKKWIIYCLVFFLAAGINSVTMKVFNLYGESAQVNEMMILASVTACVFFSLMSVVSGLRRKARGDAYCTVLPDKKTVMRVLVYILLCGIVSCGYQRLNMYLSGALPSIVFFPIFNGAVIFLSCLSGVLLFREKLSVKQIAGLVLGTLSIMLIGNVFHV